MLQASILQIYYNRIPTWVFSSEFIPGHLRTAYSVFPLIKLLCSTKSKFSAIFSQAFFSIISVRKISVSYNRQLKILVLFMQVFLLANIMVPFLSTQKSFHYLACGWNCGGNLPTVFEMKLNHELISSWNEIKLISVSSYLVI